MASRLIWICWIWWLCSQFLFWTNDTFFFGGGKSGSKKKIVSVKWKLAYAGIDYLGICWKLMLIFKFSALVQKYSFYLGFSFTNIHNSQGSREREMLSLNFSLSLLPNSLTLRHWLGNYCGQLTSAHSQLNQEPLISKSKSLTTKLHVIFG